MLIAHNAQLILASTSKVRKKILQEAGLEFETIPSSFDEEKAKKSLSLPPKKLAVVLAEQKALSVSRNFRDNYCIGADQVCEFDGQEVPKSKNSIEALEQLKKFNGKTHFQNNSVVIAFNGKIIFKNFSKAKLKMRELTEKQIEKYVNSEQPWNCAGSYKYESLGKHLFEKVSGDYYTILGLKIQPVLAFLHNQKLISIRS